MKRKQFLTTEQLENSIRSMAIPLTKRNLEKIRVFVNSDDRHHDPHFHVQLGRIKDGKWKSELETRIRLDVAEYYSLEDTRLPS